MERPKVVIVGAGFGGLAAAKELAHAPVDVTLVDRNNFHTFQPLLYQVATSGLTPGDVAYPVRGIFQEQANLHFRRATVEGADLDGRRVVLRDAEGRTEELPYDHLVVAAGATANTFGIPGVEEFGFPLYQLADAVRLRNHVLERFEAADADPSLVDRGALTFVVVGGGPTGVEVAGALAELFDMVLRRDFKSLDVGRARVVLVEMLDDLLAPFSASSRRHARETLESRGVEVRTGTAVARVEADEIELSDGHVLPTQTLVWAAGVRANPIGAALGLQTGRAGRITVGPHLATPDHPEVWAVGDVAAIVATPSRRSARKAARAAPRVGGLASATNQEVLLPQLAPVAMQSGRHVARQIRARLDGKPPEPFHYFDKGTMATIGRSRAVAELPLGIKLRGFPAWLSWLGLHLVMLAGMRNRISVFANWAWNWWTYDRGPRLILTPTEDPDSGGPTGRSGD